VTILAILAGVAGGGLTAWLAWSPFIPDPLAFHAVALALIAAIYLGFALMDGRISIAILEGTVGTVFVVLALLGLWQAPVLLAIGLILHGCWDLAHRPHGITTRLPVWYPPFCAAYDFVFAGVFLLLAHRLATRA
jgi:hypothetical protein